MRAFPLPSLPHEAEALLLGLKDQPAPGLASETAAARLEALEAYPALRAPSPYLPHWSPLEEAFSRLAQAGAKVEGKGLGEVALERRWPVLLRACPHSEDLPRVEAIWSSFSPEEQALFLEGVGLRWPREVLAREPIPSWALEAAEKGRWGALWALRGQPSRLLQGKKGMEVLGEALQQGAFPALAAALLLERLGRGGFWERLGARSLASRYKHLLESVAKSPLSVVPALLEPPPPQRFSQAGLQNPMDLFLALLTFQAGTISTWINRLQGQQAFLRFLPFWLAASDQFLGPIPQELRPGEPPGEGWGLLPDRLPALLPPNWETAEAVQGLQMALTARVWPRYVREVLRLNPGLPALVLLPPLRRLPPEVLREALDREEVRRLARGGASPLGPWPYPSCTEGGLKSP